MVGRYKVNKISVLKDNRVNATNISVQLKVKKYVEVAKSILDNNPLQRRRVKQSSTVYALLREDIKKGCIIPPLVLALYEGSEPDINDITDDYLNGIISSRSKDLIILDGLQRTYTLLDVKKELEESGDEELLDFVINNDLRIELYIGLNRLGILYRMLTLNTGQTPMSLRHQIEILYSDYLKHPIDEITFITETDDTRATNLNEYKFSDVIEGFNSYLERNELPIDKLSLLDNIKGLEKLSVENQEVDLFRSFVLTYHAMVLKVKEVTGDWQYDAIANPLSGNPFGKTIESIFKKSQAFTGFGAAIGRLKDFRLIDGFESVGKAINDLSYDDNDAQIAINNLILKLDDIRNRSKKIGNSQRMFFQYFFRELFNKESDSYSKLVLSVENSYQKFLSQTF